MWAERGSFGLLCRELLEKLSCSMCCWAYRMSVGLCKLLSIAFSWLYCLKSKISLFYIFYDVHVFRSLWRCSVRAALLLQANFNLLCPSHSSCKFRYEKVELKWMLKAKRSSLLRDKSNTRKMTSSQMCVFTFNFSVLTTFLICTHLTLTTTYFLK